MKEESLDALGAIPIPDDVAIAAGLIDPPPAPPVIEGPGRYVVYEAPDGGWIVARAVGICETCQACGCGEQADLIQVPALVIKMAGQTGKQRLMSMLGKAAGR